MARPLRIEYPGVYYHVTSRGNEQKDVFKSQKDREKFLSYLESAVVRYGAVIHAYCLMSILRNISIYCCQKYSGAKLKEIGERFGISDAAVQASRRLVLKAGKDRQ